MFNPVSTNMHRYLGPRTQMTHMFEDLIHKMQGQSPSKHFSVGFPVIHFLLRHLHDMYNFSLVFSQLANYIGTAIPWHLGTGAIGSKQAIAKEDLATVAWLHFLEMGKPNPRNVNPPPWNWRPLWGDYIKGQSSKWASLRPLDILYVLFKVDFCYGFFIPWDWDSSPLKTSWKTHQIGEVIWPWEFHHHVSANHHLGRSHFLGLPLGFPFRIVSASRKFPSGFAGDLPPPKKT